MFDPDMQEVAPYNGPQVVAILPVGWVLDIMIPPIDILDDNWQNHIWWLGVDEEEVDLGHFI